MVAGIGEQCGRIGKHAVDSLYDDDRHVQRDGKRERASMARCRRVMVMMAVAMCVPMLMRVSTLVFLIRMVMIVRGMAARVRVHMRVWLLRMRRVRIASLMGGVFHA
jgi:hypothetical protein